MRLAGHGVEAVSARVTRKAVPRHGTRDGRIAARRAQRHREVVVHRLIVQEVFLDHAALVAEAEHELGEPVMCVHFMMCRRIGRPPISTSGLGRNSVSSRSRVPWPPQRITTFTRVLLPSPRRGKGDARRQSYGEAQRVEEPGVLCAKHSKCSSKREHREHAPAGMATR